MGTTVVLLTKSRGDKRQIVTEYNIHKVCRSSPPVWLICMQNLHHPNVAEVYGIWSTESSLYLVTEYSPLHTLYDCFHSTDLIQIREEERESM